MYWRPHHVSSCENHGCEISSKCPWNKFIELATDNLTLWFCKNWPGLNVSTTNHQPTNRQHTHHQPGAWTESVVNLYIQSIPRTSPQWQLIYRLCLRCAKILIYIIVRKQAIFHVLQQFSDINLMRNVPWAENWSFDICWLSNLKSFRSYHELKTHHSPLDGIVFRNYPLCSHVLLVNNNHSQSYCMLFWSALIYWSLIRFSSLIIKDTALIVWQCLTFALVGGGVILAPPCGFSRITRKRKGAAQPNLAYLFLDQFYICCEIFASGSHQVRSPGRVTWPNLQKGVCSCHSYSS